MLLVDSSALLGLVDRQVMNLLENTDEVVVDPDGRKLLFQKLERLLAARTNQSHEFNTNLFLIVFDCLSPLVTLLLGLADVLASRNHIFAEVVHKSFVT